MPGAEQGQELKNKVEKLKKKTKVGRGIQLYVKTSEGQKELS